jgi:Zn-finger nucleic acid-binding protein
MDCPHHAVALLKSEKHGIEIDYCPQCHGAWFERGELDKVIEVYRELARRAHSEMVHPAEQVGHGHRVESRRYRDLRKIADLLEEIFD